MLMSLSPQESRPLSRSRIAVIIGLLGLTGCSTLSHETAQVAAIFTPKTKIVAPTPIATPEMKLPPDWLTIESTVVSLGEQDLLTRMQMGFQLSDVDGHSVDVEENWYANHPDYLDRTFRRGERYLYYIVSELEARKMPLELALLPVVESAYNPSAYSRAKAAGLWQFIPATGTRFGLKQNLYYDGRRDVMESTRAALDYLQFLNNEFNGDWLLAIAAYNAGELNVSRAVQRNLAKGKPTDFFSLDLPRETEAYVPKLLAMKRIVENPSRHGLEFGSIDNHPYFVKVDVGGQIDLALAAQLAGMTKDDFLAINPGFKRAVTDPNGPHQLLIPVDNKQAFVEKLAALPDSARIPMVYYQVRRGDTLLQIAKRYGLEVAEIRDLNHLKHNAIKPGQELLLRGTSKATAASIAEQIKDNEKPTRHASNGRARTHTVRSGETLWSIAQRYDVDPSVLASLNGIRRSAIKAGQKLKIPGTSESAANSKTNRASTTASTQEQVVYTVQHGDTLSDIAGQFRVDIEQVMTWNNIESPRSLKAGQQLVIYMDDNRRSGG
jgi:membrane-bound lytic murein transglycosylase D